MFNMFTGGALGRMTVFALNIMPYISASIIVQLMSSAVPALEALKKEGESGRKAHEPVHALPHRPHRPGPIVRQSPWGLEGMHGTGGAVAVADPGWFFRSSCVITLVGGTMFLMWLGEQITARGIGNGTSLIIFSGIVANLPNALGNLLETRPHRRPSRRSSSSASWSSARRSSPSSSSWSAPSAASSSSTPSARWAAACSAAIARTCR